MYMNLFFLLLNFSIRLLNKLGKFINIIYIYEFSQINDISRRLSLFLCFTFNEDAMEILFKFSFYTKASIYMA